MKGQIFKIHSDFYYVDTAQGTYECKIREVLKKRKDAIVVGDFVELEQLNENSKQAFVSKVLPRKSFIPRQSGQCKSGDYCLCTERAGA